MADEIKKDWRIEDVEKTKGFVEKWRKILFPPACVGIALLIISAIVVFFHLGIAFWLFVASVVCIFPWYATHSFKTIKEWENGVVFFFKRLYRYKTGTNKGKISSKSLRKPGLTWIWWPVESIKFVQMYERKLDIPPQEVILQEKIATELGVEGEKNPIVIQVDPIFWFRVTSAPQSIVAVEGVESALTQLFITMLRSECSKKTLQDLIDQKDKIAKDIEGAIKTELEEYGEDKSWGVEVTKVGLQEIKPPKDIVDAMHGVYVSDKARKQGIINADREKQQIQIAYPAITAQKSGLEIRTLQAWERASQGAGSTVVLAGLSSIMRNLLGHQGDGPLGGLRHPGRD